MKIYQNHQAGLGFKELHVRSRIKQGVLSAIPLEELAKYFPEKETFETVNYLKSKETVVEAFAFKLSPIVFYGHLQNGSATTLGLHYISNPSDISARLIESIAQLMKVKNLLLVDWVHLALVDTESLEKYFYQA